MTADLAFYQNLSNMKKLPFLSLLILGLALGACQNRKAQDAGYTSFRLDEIFELPFARTARLADGELTLRFQDVPEDSRCPEGVTCVWAGQVTVVLAAKLAEHRQDLRFTREAKSKKNVTNSFQGYKVHLLGVEPYPREGSPLKKEDYRLRLSVRKGG